jgi:hypothetical protein
MDDKLIPVPDERAGMLATIERIVGAGPLDSAKVDVIERMMAMQERLIKDQRKQEFDDAIARIQADIPQIEKDGRITGGSNAAYSRYETIDDYIRPLLAREGVAIRVSEEASADENGRILFSMTVSKGGHSETVQRRFSVDVGATTRDGRQVRSKIQDDGSTSTYAKRYLLIAFFNIVTRNMDTDGRSARPITQDQARDIEALISEVKADKARWLAYMGVSAVEDILATDYKKAVSSLESKRR